MEKIYDSSIDLESEYHIERILFEKGHDLNMQLIDCLLSATKVQEILCEKIEKIESKLYDLEEKVNMVIQQNQWIIGRSDKPTN